MGPGPTAVSPVVRGWCWPFAPPLHWILRRAEFAIQAVGIVRAPAERLLKMIAGFHPACGGSVAGRVAALSKLGTVHHSPAERHGRRAAAGRSRNPGALMPDVRPLTEVAGYQPRTSSIQQMRHSVQRGHDCPAADSDLSAGLSVGVPVPAHRKRASSASQFPGAAATLIVSFPRPLSVRSICVAILLTGAGTD